MKFQKQKDLKKETYKNKNESDARQNYQENFYFQLLRVLNGNLMQIA